MNNFVLFNMLLIPIFIFSTVSRAEPPRGWRCVSKVASSCEQGIFNEIERLAALNIREATQNGSYGLVLKELRVGELLATGYFEGKITVDSKIYLDQELEITFAPGSDVDGTVIPSLGRDRYSIGDGLPTENGGSFWAGSSPEIAKIRKYYTDLLRDSFSKAVRQASGLESSVSKGSDQSPQNCWRGCSKNSDEKKFHDIALLAKSIMATRSKSIVKVPLRLSCVYYRPNGADDTMTMPHFEKNSRHSVIVDIPYESNLEASSIELFTDSAQAILEGQIRIAGTSTQVQLSSSYYAGPSVEGNLIPGFGARWQPLGGPDNSNFWERNIVEFDVYNRVPLIRLAEYGGKYPREVHCFLDGTAPNFGPLENPEAYEKLNLRNKRYLPRNLTPLLDLVNSVTIQSFTYAVKVFSKSSKLTADEFNAYSNGYFKNKLSITLAALQNSHTNAKSSLESFLAMEGTVNSVIEEAIALITAAKPTADQLLASKGKLLNSMTAVCKSNSLSLDASFENLNNAFDDFLEFKEESAVIFNLSEQQAAHNATFASLSPSESEVSATIANIENQLRKQTLCQRLSSSLSGIYKKIESLRIEGNQEILENISSSAADALKQLASGKEKNAAELALTMQFENLARSYNTSFSRLSYSETKASLDAIQNFIDSTIPIELSLLNLISDSQKSAIKDSLNNRYQNLSKDFGDSLSDAGGEYELLKLRYESSYEKNVDALIVVLKASSLSTQKSFLLGWNAELLKLDFEIPSNCNNPEFSFENKKSCWLVTLPKSDKDSVFSFDRKLSFMIKYIQNNLPSIR